MRVVKLMPLMALLLVGCSDDRASFMANDMQSLTVKVMQKWFWSKPYLNVVVRGEPNCQREYFLQDLSDKKVPLDIYLYEGNSYALLADGQKYIFDLANCDMTRYRDIPDLKPQDRQGQFRWDAEGFTFHKAP